MDLSLSDIVRLVVVCLIGGASIIAAMIVWHGRATIGALLGAVRRRYLTVSLGRVVETIADDHYDEPPPDPVGSVTGTRNVSVPDTDALERGVFQPVLAPGDTEAWLRYVATLRWSDGSYCQTMNKLAESSGMNRNRALEIIRAARGQPDPPPDPRATLIARENGRERLISR